MEKYDERQEAQRLADLEEAQQILGEQLEPVSYTHLEKETETQTETAGSEAVTESETARSEQQTEEAENSEADSEITDIDADEFDDLVEQAPVSYTHLNQRRRQCYEQFHMY